MAWGFLGLRLKACKIYEVSGPGVWGWNMWAYDLRESDITPARDIPPKCLCRSQHDAKALRQEAVEHTNMLQKSTLPPFLALLPKLPTPRIPHRIRNSRSHRRCWGPDSDFKPAQEKIFSWKNSDLQGPIDPRPYPGPKVSRSAIDPKPEVFCCRHGKLGRLLPIVCTAHLCWATV